MSLINEALKRADAEKHGAAPRDIPLPPVPAPAAPTPAAPARSYLTAQNVILAGALVAAAIAGGAFLITHRGPSADDAALALLQATAPRQAAAAPAVERTTDGTPVVATAITQVVPTTQVTKPPAASTVQLATALAAATGLTRGPAAGAGLSLDPKSPELAQAVAGAVNLFLDPSKAKAAAALASTLAATAPAAAPATPDVAAPKASPAPEPEPAAAPPPAEPQFTVTSIVGKANGGMAVINGRVVEVGDTIDGAKVIAVRPRSVDLLIGGKTITIRL